MTEFVLVLFGLLFLVLTMFGFPLSVGFFVGGLFFLGSVFLLFSKREKGFRSGGKINTAINISIRRYGLFALAMLPAVLAFFSVEPPSCAGRW